ncbi:leucine-rich repeat and guanylate kinase domain-containing -like, partial [Paramuricea clavata]
MADDTESEIGDATEITDESFLKEFNSTVEIQNDEVVSQLSENIDTQSLQEVEKTQDGSETEEDWSYLEDMIANGLSQLGRSADGTMQVFLSLTLNNFDLIDISILKNYKHLQTIILSNNKLTDLSVLGCMESLVKLDVSHNEVTTLLDFQPPKNLVEVNFCHNVIEELPDLSQHRRLVTLILDYNNIEEIKGLSSCYCLKKLSLAHNRIQRISGLTNLPLTHLNLSHNNIRKIENLETLKYLKEINLEGNQIIDIAEIRYIRELRLLRKLNFQRNPIQEMSDYRLSILFRLQMLTFLDGTPVTPNEKVHATNMFNPPRDVIAARDHMVHVVRSLMQPAKVFDSTLTSMATPYPMLVLTGPSGGGKRYLAKKLCQEFPDYFGLGVSTTTRPQRRKEDDGIDYFFTTQAEFEKDVMEGKFIETAQCGGYLYGITREAIESVARKGLACTVHMAFE